MVREDIFEALFAVLTASQLGPYQFGAFKTADRRLVHWSKVASQPAVFLEEDDEEWPDAESVRPRFGEVRANVWLYSKGGADPTQPPAKELNGLIDMIRRALLPPLQFRLPLTLGFKAVLHCRIQGRVFVYPGHLDGQAIAIVPVVIRVAEGQ